MSNDLFNQNYTPETFASDLIAFAEYLVRTLQVQKVVILQLLPTE